MHRGIQSKIVVLGDGLLGGEIVNQTGWDNISRKKDGFDITKKENFYKYFVSSEFGAVYYKKYDCIVNCVASTNTYSADKNIHWDTNYVGIANLVDFCNEWGIKLVHISTDYVYTNSISEATEDDIPIHGNNWYSYTKLLADAYVELKSKDYLICRGTHKPFPFPYKDAWGDQVGNFDYVNKIAEFIIKLINKDSVGLFNVGTELKSMYQLAFRSNERVLMLNKPSNVPSDTSMNVTKMEKCLSEN
jgi:dTDP-4-dehydrorhamnose reductase